MFVKYFLYIVLTLKLKFCSLAQALEKMMTPTGPASNSVLSESSAVPSLNETQTSGTSYSMLLSSLISPPRASFNHPMSVLEI